MSANDHEADIPMTPEAEALHDRFFQRLTDLEQVGAEQMSGPSAAEPVRPRVHFAPTVEAAPSEGTALHSEHTPQPDASPRPRIRRKIGGAATARIVESHDEPQDSSLSPAARTRIMATAAKIAE